MSDLNFDKMCISVRSLGTIKGMLEHINGLSHDEKVKAIGYDTNIDYYIEVMAELIKRKEKENSRVKRVKKDLRVRRMW